MKLLLSLFVLIVLGYSGYVGYKRGIISGLLDIAALTISIYVAFLVSNTYSGEFVGLVNPFVGGLVDSVVTDTVTRDYTQLDNDTADPTATAGEEDGKISIMLEPVMTLTDADKQDPFTVCVASLRRLGIAESASEKIALRVSEQNRTVGQRFIDTVSKEFSITVCRVALFIIAFILVTILFAVIGNILNVNFGLPGLELVNNIGGAAAGVVKGIIILMVIACVMRYTGLVIPEEKLTGATLFAIFLNKNFIASKVGI